MLDLHLAIAHHLVIFCVFGVVAAELFSLRPGMTARDTHRLARIDLGYGIFAGLTLIVGFARASLAAKGWDYYAHNAYFWSKIGTFAIIGLLSVPPTVVYVRCRRAGTTLTGEQVGSLRLFLWAEVVLFAPLLGFAAAMARGYGQY